MMNTATNLGLVATVSWDDGREVYRLQSLPQMSATDMGNAIRSHAANVERIATLEARLKDAIRLLQMWHDSGNDRVAYRFDLTDHPKVIPLFAALKKEAT